MVQASDEQSGTINGKTRGPLKVESSIPQEEQKSKGWYWCHKKQGLFRYSDWHKTLDELNLVSL
jgi:ligand-binding sensor domain-containing protein